MRLSQRGSTSGIKQVGRLRPVVGSARNCLNCGKAQEMALHKHKHIYILSVAILDTYERERAAQHSNHLVLVVFQPQHCVLYAATKCL
jgi:hypothetical protein